MKVTLSEPNSFTRHLAVEVEEEKINDKFETVLRELRRTLQLPGFRAGKVPRDMALKKYGGTLREEAVEKVINESLDAAFRDHQLSPISRPILKKLDAKPGSPLVFEAEVEIDPPVNITDYRDLNIAIESEIVTEANVDALLEELRDRLSTLNPVNRPVKMGDYVDLSYTQVVIGGEEKKDFQSPTHPVEVGASRLTALEEGMVGLKNGDEKTIGFSFPADYPVPSLAGKDAAFSVKVNGVREKVQPPLDDSLAKEVRADAQTLGELRQKLREDLEEDRKREAISKAQDAVVDQLLARNPFEVPESKVTHFLSHSYENYVKQARGETPVPREEFNEKNRKAAIREIKRYKALDVISKKENIKASGEEVDAELRKYAGLTGQTFEKIKAEFKRDGRILDVRENLRDRKTLEFLAGVPSVPTAQPQA